LEKIMIVVSAATGEFGRLVVDQLLNRVPASDVAAAVRDVYKAADLADRGAQLRHGDYEEPDSLRDSFNGADRLLFISAPSSDSGERKRQHHNVVDAARSGGVGHLVYTSGLADWPNQLGGSYDFTGRRWTFDELAQVPSDMSGRTITRTGGR
jgi:NAD(P)H dehydrogenase (quinone)